LVTIFVAKEISVLKEQKARKGAVSERWVRSAGMAVCLMLFCLVGRAPAQEGVLNETDTGRVYVMTDRAEGNSVVVLQRDASGVLSIMAEVPTGGFGNGPVQLPAPFPPDPGPSPLTSQDGLVMTEDGRFLIAVNAGSNEVSVLAVTDDGLQLVDKVPSGGNFPNSIAHHNGLIYVMNQGELPPVLLHAVPKIAGFFLDVFGKLHPIPNSITVTGDPDSQPGDVVFSPDGRFLIITDKFNAFATGSSPSLLHVRRINLDGTTAEVASYPANNRAPLGSDFDRHGIFAVTEANAGFVDGNRVSIPNGSSMSSYIFTPSGQLEPVSKAVPTFQTVACWVRFTPDGRYAYVANKGSGSISLFLVADDGEITLLNSVAADTGGVNSGPLDEGITPDGQFLYVTTGIGGLPPQDFTLPLPPNPGAVKGYRIHSDGSLTPVAEVDGFPLSVVGMVAR
jgi:6-phosphogluconolactonase